MGLLSLGTPLPWNEAKKYADHVREHGIDQFLHIYRKTRDKTTKCLLWGDEIEYIMVNVDDEHRKTKLALRAFEVLSKLQKAEQDFEQHVTDQRPVALWRPEYGRYMVEGTPGEPYGSTFRDLIQVEANMKERRRLAEAELLENELILSIVNYPRLGCPGELEPDFEPKGVACQSLFVPDEISNPHARFPTLTANIRQRRTAKVEINVPIFHDINTPRPFIDPTIPYDRDVFVHDHEAKDGAAKPDHIYMDAMAFGMGCCCLQITFQACNLDEARRLYDQLAPIAPIMLALTAASPIFRGYLADVDCRWDVIAASVDDRSPEERGLKPLEHDRFVINKSRYDSIDSYLSTDPLMKSKYNDIDLVYDKAIYQKLRDNGVDDLLARHMAHLFIRDPLVIFKELLDQDDSVSADHFENIQSTNWQTLRFKPPPPNSTIGWRVEFRSMEVQLTDFENAAFAVFIVLLTRVILSFGLNFYMPLSKVDENMATAQKRDAVLDQKFYFRKNIYTVGACCNESYPTPDDQPATDDQDDNDGYELMTMDEIINGKGQSFPGLIPMIENYLNNTNIDVESRCQLRRYLSLISQRASGKLMTSAAYLRRLVTQHPEYKHDSVVSSSITYDLIKTAQKLSNGELKAPELLGE